MHPPAPNRTHQTCGAITRSLWLYECCYEECTANQRYAAKNVCPACGEPALTAVGPPCQAQIVPGKNRCRMHGDMSTGARSPEGKHRAARAAEKGRRTIHYRHQVRERARVWWDWVVSATGKPPVKMGERTTS